MLRYSHKEREFLASYQKSVQDKFPEGCIWTKSEVNFADAPHRWQSKSRRYAALTLTFVSFQWKTADDSMNMSLKKVRREKCAHAVRETCNNESAVLCAFHADFLSKCMQVTDQVQPDMLDGTTLARLMLAHCDEVIGMFFQSKLLTHAGKGSFTHLMIAQLKLVVHTFAFGNNEVGSVGSLAALDAVVQGALKIYRHVIVLHVKLVRSFYTSEVPDVWLQAFDLEAWRLANAQGRSADGVQARKKLQDSFIKFNQHQEVSECTTEFEALRTGALHRFCMARMKLQRPHRQMSSESLIMSVGANL